MIAPLVSFPVLVAFWLFVGWRVRVERGRVHLSPFQVWARNIARVQRQIEAAIAVAMVSIGRQSLLAFEAFNQQVRFVQKQLATSEPEIRRMFEEAGLPWML